MNKYVVCIKEIYTRDTQIADCLSAENEGVDWENEEDLWDFLDDDDGAWIDRNGDMFLGIYEAKTESEALEIAAKENRLVPQMLCGYKI